MPNSQIKFSPFLLPLAYWVKRKRSRVNICRLWVSDIIYMCVFFFFSVGSFCCPVFCFNGLVYLFVFMYMPNSVNMGDKFGQVKVMVVQGRRLVIRDFKSSDPYVILKLGNQVTNTPNSSKKIQFLAWTISIFVVPDCKNQGHK